METLIEASNNNWYNFFVIFVNDEANFNFWPTYVEIWDICPNLVWPTKHFRTTIVFQFVLLNTVLHSVIGKKKIYYENLPA